MPRYICSCYNFAELYYNIYEGVTTISNEEILKVAINSQGIYEYGICAYGDISVLLPCKNASRIPDNAKSIITLAIPYYTGEYDKSNLCRYARVPDYHKVVMNMLDNIVAVLTREISGEYSAFCDISALPEKECAVLSGIGFMGKNGLVINKNLGSYFVIGEIVSDVIFNFSQPCTDSCKNCRACVNACANQILNESSPDYSMCLSAITQKKGDLTYAEINLIRENQFAWGCDKCQEVCPHNKDLPYTNIPEFRDDIEPVLTSENLTLLRKSRAFSYRSASLLRRNLTTLD